MLRVRKTLYFEGVMASSSEKKTTTKKQKNQTLIIVESPAKAKTIEKYLGPGFTVKASMGHLIDLPKSRIAVDVENNFQPEYITVRGRAKILKDLQSGAKVLDLPSSFGDENSTTSLSSALYLTDKTEEDRRFSKDVMKRFFI